MENNTATQNNNATTSSSSTCNSSMGNCGCGSKKQKSNKQTPAKV
jgi:hypothetical protein